MEENRQAEALKVILDRMNQEDVWFTSKEDDVYCSAKNLFKLDEYGDLVDKSKERLLNEVEDLIGDGATYLIEAVDQWIQDNLIQGIISYKDNLHMNYTPKEISEEVTAYQEKGVEDLGTEVAEEQKKEKKTESKLVESTDKFEVTSYYDNKYRGVEDSLETDDISKAEEFIWDKAQKGNYVELVNVTTGDTKRYSPDKFDENTIGIEELEESKKVTENTNTILNKVFCLYPDISEEDEDYLTSLSEEDLIQELKNRGWTEALQESKKVTEGKRTKYQIICKAEDNEEFVMSVLDDEETANQWAKDYKKANPNRDFTVNKIEVEPSNRESNKWASLPFPFTEYVENIILELKDEGELEDYTAQDILDIYLDEQIVEYSDEEKEEIKEDAETWDYLGYIQEQLDNTLGKEKKTESFRVFWQYKDKKDNTKFTSKGRFSTIEDAQKFVDELKSTSQQKPISEPEIRTESKKLKKESKSDIYYNVMLQGPSGNDIYDQVNTHKEAVASKNKGEKEYPNCSFKIIKMNGNIPAQKITESKGCNFKKGDKVKIDYISDGNEHNGKVGTIKWIREYKYYPNGKIDEFEYKCQAQIEYPDGSTETVKDLNTKGSGVTSTVNKMTESNNPNSGKILNFIAEKGGCATIRELCDIFPEDENGEIDLENLFSCIDKLEGKSVELSNENAEDALDIEVCLILDDGVNNAVKGIDKLRQQYDANVKSESKKIVESKAKVYQLEANEKNHGKIFARFSEVGNVNLKDYKEVANIDVEDNMSDNEALEYVFELGNTNREVREANPEMRSISVSDVILLNGKYYYCDAFGWKEITNSVTESKKEKKTLTEDEDNLETFEVRTYFGIEVMGSNYDGEDYLDNGEASEMLDRYPEIDVDMLFDAANKLMRKEDLANYLPDNLKSVIKSIKLHIEPTELVARIKAPMSFYNDKNTEDLANYLEGQYSDGWGESFEQKALYQINIEDDQGKEVDANVYIQPQLKYDSAKVSLTDSKEIGRKKVVEVITDLELGKNGLPQLPNPFEMQYRPADDLYQIVNKGPAGIEGYCYAVSDEDDYLGTWSIFGNSDEGIISYEDNVEDYNECVKLLAQFDGVALQESKKTESKLVESSDTSKRKRLNEENQKSADLISQALSSKDFDIETPAGQIVSRTSELFNVLSDKQYDVQVTFDNGESQSAILLGNQGGKVMITITNGNEPLRAFASGNFELTEENFEILKDIKEQISVI